LEYALTQLDKIMKSATKTSDVLSIFTEQTKLQKKLDILKGRINYYQQAVAYSRITINMVEEKAIVNQYIQQQKQWRFTKVVKNTYQTLINGLKMTINQMLYLLIVVLPILLLWGGIIILAYLVVSWLYRHIMKTKD